MRKNKILFLLLTLMSCSLVAQNIGSGLKTFLSTQNYSKSKSLFFSDRFSVYEEEGGEYISLLAKLKKDVENADVLSYDCKITSSSGKIVCLRAKVDGLDALLKSGLFEKVDVARKIGGQHLDKALVDVNADYVHQGVEGLVQGYDGTGVIIGVADWGFDYTHPVFYDTLMNNYRVLAAWDQYRSGFAPPENYDYGAYIEGIDNLLSASCDTNNIYDLGLHGTHVASIAAGGGAGTKYRGVAYGAELLFATWLIDETNVLDSYSWMRDEAKRRGKRLVVNNSWGIYHFGAMDGTSLFDEYVYNLSQEDSVVFVSSAGNNRRSNFHVKCDFNTFDTIRTKFDFNLPLPASDDYWGQTVNLVADSTSAFSSAVELYTSNGTLLFSTDMFSTEQPIVTEGFFVYNETDSLIYRLTSVSGNEGRAQMEWEVRLSNPNAIEKTVLVVSSESGFVHGWNVACLTTGVGNWGLPFAWFGNSSSVIGNDEYSIGEPAIGRGMIAVAAHTSGRRTGYSNCNIAPFSSMGPNLCEYMKPEISAPGVSIVGALSSFTTDERNGTSPVEFNSKTYEFVALSGTSMSSPMVTGVVALMLQANPNLTAEQVKEIITSTARHDSFTGEDIPNYTWGWGKIDALQAVKRAVELVGLESVSMQSEVKLMPNPTKGLLQIDNMPNDCDCVEVCDMFGRCILKMKSVSTIIDVNMLEAGIYFLNLYQEGNRLSFKFIKN